MSIHKSSLDIKLQTLAEDYGFADPMEMAEAYILDSVCPAICCNPDCDYSTEYEPDQDMGWCEACEENSVKSALVIMGVI